jgi:hypothetical protein
MSPGFRAFLRMAFLSLLVGVVGICGEARAQSGNAPSDGAKAQNASGPKKPTRKADQVLTNDSVVLLGVKKTPTATEKPTGQTTSAGTADAGATAEDKEKKAAEIASLEKQIQDKTKKIVLLMRLFVDDERPFLNDPANHKVDATAQDRRKYEQDELLYETAELAKLKARLNEITAGK